MSKKGQVGLFVIVAILIVGGIIVFSAVKDKLDLGIVPSEVKSVFSYYEKCIEDETKTAVELAGIQGGRINVGAYEPGSAYAPFSSQLNFLGFPVPYWFYVSGNGIVKYNVPTKKEMEDEIAEYVEDGIRDCNFEAFYNQGFDIELGEPKVSVSVVDNKVDVDVNEEINVAKGDVAGRKNKYSISVGSRLGKFYSIAKNIYAKEMKDMFLENYAIDVLRLYAPVDGVERGCSPKVWKTREVTGELRESLEANIEMLKFKGDYYNLKNNEGKYFVIDNDVDVPARIIYSKDWPTKIEVVGGDGELLIAKPIGSQEGLGVLGFCYMPYHFVWDVSFPVLIQIGDGIEMFQFPVVVVIDNNLPREVKGEFVLSEEGEEDVCKYKTRDIEVNLYDVNLNIADANVSYVCFSQRCELGESSGGKLAAKAPACVNGQVIISGGGYAEKKVLMSSNKENAIDVILDKEYDIDIEILVNGKKIENIGSGVVSFAGEKVVSSALPESSKVKLQEGLYNVSVYVYSNASIKIPASKKTECFDVPKGGLLGFFGSSKEECVEIGLPETTIDSALIGGGFGEVYMFPEDLSKGKIVIDVKGLPKPNSIEQLQYNLESFEDLKANMRFE